MLASPVNFLCEVLVDDKRQKTGNEVFCRIKIYSYICNPFVYGAISSVGRALDCGSRCRGFEPHIAPLGRAGNLTALFVTVTER